MNKELNTTSKNEIREFVCMITISYDNYNDIIFHFENQC